MQKLLLKSYNRVHIVGFAKEFEKSIYAPTKFTQLLTLHFKYNGVADTLTNC